MLPLLPGLMPKKDESDDDAAAGAAATLPANPLGAYLDELGDDIINELNASAAQYAEENPAAASDTVPAPPPGEEEDTPADPDAAPDSDDAPAEGSEDGEPAAADLEQINTHAQAAVGESAQMLSAMQDLDGGDNQSDIDKLIKQATAFDAAVQKSADLAEKAVSKEDAEAAAQAGIDAQESLEVVQHLHEAAMALVNKTTVQPMTPADHPALKTWAARVLKKAPAVRA